VWSWKVPKYDSKAAWIQPVYASFATLLLLKQYFVCCVDRLNPRLFAEIEIKTESPLLNASGINITLCAQFPGAPLSVNA
jgi:hypothetical protein